MSRIAGYFLNNIFHEDKGHFATGQKTLFVFSENLGGGGGGGLGPLVPTPLNSSDMGTCTPNIRNSSARSHACIKSRN